MQNLLSRPMLLKLNRFFHRFFFFTNSHLHVWNLAVRLHKAELKIDLVCITSLSHKGRPKWTPQVCHTLFYLKKRTKFIYSAMISGQVVLQCSRIGFLIIVMCTKSLPILKWWQIKLKSCNRKAEGWIEPLNI